MKKDAAIDETEQYRYWLLREWNNTLPKLVFIMLNPSTADASIDDPTIKRCISFASKLNFGSIQVVNLFAYRATDPKNLKNKSIDPVGKLNDKYIIDTCRNSDLIIAAWGVNGSLNARDKYVTKLIGTNTYDLHCLGMSKDGHPRHPLYVKGDVKPMLYKEKIFHTILSAIPTVERKISSREGIDKQTLSDYAFHKDIIDE